VAIVALVLYVITAAAGVSLLGTGGAARRREAEAEAAEAAEAAGTEEAGAGGETKLATAQATSAAGEAARALGIQARLAAVPLTADGKPPPGPKVKVLAPPGDHPLLEFSHPALAVTGLACWFMYVFVRYTPFAWISFGILMVAIAIGITWLVRNLRAARRRLKGAWHFPPRLVLLHGTAAAVAILLSVLTALSASHV
jgi:Flp pilus assembly protein TadB